MAAGSQSFSIPLVTEMQVALYRKAGLTRSLKDLSTALLSCPACLHVVSLLAAEAKKYMNHLIVFSKICCGRVSIEAMDSKNMSNLQILACTSTWSEARQAIPGVGILV